MAGRLFVTLLSVRCLGALVAALRFGAKAALPNTVREQVFRARQICIPLCEPVCCKSSK